MLYPFRLSTLSFKDDFTDVHEDIGSKAAVMGIVEAIVNDMRERVRNGEDGPHDLEYEQVYQLFTSGILGLDFEPGNPPRPRFVVCPPV